MNIPKVKFVFRNNNSIGFLTLDNKIHYNKNIYNLVLNNDHSIKQLNTKLYFYDNVGNLQYFDLIDNQFYKVDIIPKEVKWPFSDEIFIQFESNDKEFLSK